MGVLTAVQTSTVSAMHPGDSAQTLSGNFTNPTMSVDSEIPAGNAQGSWTGASLKFSDVWTRSLRFDSYESAMRNSELPETTEVAEQMAKLCDGPVRFLNLDVIATW